MTVAPAAPSSLVLLMDTNIFIAVEPFAGRLEPALPVAAELMRLVVQLRYRVVIHPANSADLAEGTDLVRRAQQLAALGKYQMLAEGTVPQRLRAAVGPIIEGSNDERDLRLLAAVDQKAAGS